MNIIVSAQQRNFHSNCCNSSPKIGGGGSFNIRRCRDLQETEGCKKLGELLDFHGSDKNYLHFYTPCYADIFVKLGEKQVQILEMGLGTNNIDTASNMGENGKPGASLRAFRDFLPHGQIFDVYIDERILFNEERIRTAFVDQLNPETLQKLPQKFGVEGFDLIIDDGLHNSEANLNTLLFAMNAVKVGGFIVIEDILEKTLPLWQLVDNVIDKSHFDSTMYHGKAHPNQYLYLLHRKQ